MEPQTQSNSLLVGIGVLLFVLGGLLGFALIPAPAQEQMVSDVMPEQEEVSTYAEQERTYLERIALPEPDRLGGMSVTQALAERRSRREFAEESLSLPHLSQMLWAAQGITSERGGRTAPSARDIYPTTLFVAVASAEEVAPGVYEYLPETHELGLLIEGEVGDAWNAITPQPHPQNAPVTLFVNGNVLKPVERYGTEGARRVTYLEAGHVGQNLYLQAEALGLATLTMGGLDPAEARAFLGTTQYDEVLYLVPIGYRAAEVVDGEE